MPYITPPVNRPIEPHETHAQWEWRSLQDNLLGEFADNAPVPPIDADALAYTAAVRAAQIFNARAERERAAYLAQHANDAEQDTEPTANESPAQMPAAPDWQAELAAQHKEKYGVEPSVTLVTPDAENTDGASIESLLGLEGVPSTAGELADLAAKRYDRDVAEAAERRAALGVKDLTDEELAAKYPMPADLEPTEVPNTPLSLEDAARAARERLPQVPEFIDPTPDQIAGMDLVPYQMPAAGQPVWVPRRLLDDWKKDPVHLMAIPLASRPQVSQPPQQIAA